MVSVLVPNCRVKNLPEKASTLKDHGTVETENGLKHPHKQTHSLPRPEQQEF